MRSFPVSSNTAGPVSAILKPDNEKSCFLKLFRGFSASGQSLCSNEMTLRRKFFLNFLKASLVFLLTGVLLEAFWTCMLARPDWAAKLPAGLFNRVNILYIESSRKMIQTEPQSIQYHPKLAYLLRPGTWKFSNPEFSNTFHVNQAGFRDDEISFQSPEVIVAGDSFAMGWGVEQDETFAQVLEKKTGFKVLNMGVASYGTAREMRALDLVDTSRLRYLILQYSDNDYEENKDFFRRKNKISVNTEAEQLGAIENARKERRYWPGRYTWMAVKSLPEAFRNLSHPKKNDPEFRRDKGFLFLNALMYAHRADLSGVRVITFEINSHGGGDSGQDFFYSLVNTVLLNDFPPFIKRMKVIDFSKRLKDREHYYVLDDHLNAKGHQAVADLTLQAMNDIW